jgi:hypothetical protein
MEQQPNDSVLFVAFVVVEKSRSLQLNLQSFLLTSCFLLTGEIMTSISFLQVRDMKLLPESIRDEILDRRKCRRKVSERLTSLEGKQIKDCIACLYADLVPRWFQVLQMQKYSPL